MDSQKDKNALRWRENIAAVLLFLALLGLIIFSAANSTPFVYGRF
jgi:hypothetical protein